MRTAVHVAWAVVAIIALGLSLSVLKGAGGYAVAGLFALAWVTYAVYRR